MKKAHEKIILCKWASSYSAFVARLSEGAEAAACVCVCVCVCGGGGYGTSRPPHRQLLPDVRLLLLLPRGIGPRKELPTPPPPLL